MYCYNLHKKLILYFLPLVFRFQSHKQRYSLCEDGKIKMSWSTWHRVLLNFTGKNIKIWPETASIITLLLGFPTSVNFISTLNSFLICTKILPWKMRKIYQIGTGIMLELIKTINSFRRPDQTWNQLSFKFTSRLVIWKITWGKK